jgi:hypothetical protein
MISPLEYMQVDEVLSLDHHHATHMEVVEEAVAN